MSSQDFDASRDKKKTNAVYGSSAACNHRVLPTIHHYYLPKLRGYAASEIDFLLLFNPLPGPLSSSLLTSYHIFVALCTGYFFPLPPPLVRAPHLPKTSSKYEKVNLGKPSIKKSAVFLNIVQKAFGPPPLLFEHLSYFAGGVF